MIRPGDEEAPEDTDVLIVGAGPIGLACAIHARAAGYDVVVVDRRPTPIDKACGEGLFPGAVQGLTRLGVTPPGHPLTGISYRDARTRADHLFETGTGLGVRRTALQESLYARALACGARIRRGTLTTLHQDTDTVRAAGVRARWLLGCDGLHSSVRRLAGLDLPARRAPARYGLRRHYHTPPWSSLVEVHWGPTTEAYVTPVGPGLVGVAVLGPRGLDLEATIRDLPDLAEHLDGAEPAGPLRGAGPLRQHSRRRTAGRVRLVGDASGYLDALTGDGLRIGLAQAEAVIHHLEDTGAYERAWRHITRPYRILTGGLLTWATSPARHTIVPAARAWPAGYGAVVEHLAR